MVIYPRLPVLAPEVRCFFLYVFGVQSYLLTFGVWKPRDSCKMLKQKPYRKHFLPQGIAQEIFKIFANHQDDPRYQVTKLPFPHGCFFGNLEPQGQPLKNGWKWWVPTISYVKIGNHPIDSQAFINGWLQGVPGTSSQLVVILTWHNLQDSSSDSDSESDTSSSSESASSESSSEAVDPASGPPSPNEELVGLWVAAKGGVIWVMGTDAV